MNIIILNRWSDDFGDYVGLIDHTMNDVTYITNVDGSKYLEGRTGYAMHYEIQNLSSKEAVEQCIDSYIDTHGSIDRLIALSENDMLMAGYLRTKYGIQGMSHQTALNFVDKVNMKKALSGSGIRFPKYTTDLQGCIDDFCASTGFPLVVKPRVGNSSRGVHVVQTYGELKQLIDSLDDKTKYECEEFIAGPIFHIDGVVLNDEILFSKGSQYINTCLSYEYGEPVGSIIVNNNDLQSRFNSYAGKVMRSLGLGNGVFHLEAILHKDELVFMEVGARQGGGEIVPMIKHLYGVDLIAAFVRTQMLLPIHFRASQTGLVGGFVLFPEPRSVPSRVLSHNSMKQLQSLVYEIIPEKGTVLTGSGGYYFNSGRFMFSGNHDQVLNDMHETLETFHISFEKV